MSTEISTKSVQAATAVHPSAQAEPPLGRRGSAGPRANPGRFGPQGFHREKNGDFMVILWDFHDFMGILWDFHDFMGILWDFMEFSSSSPSENRDLGLNRPQVSQLSAKIEN
jgi:hypothetical protein